MSSDPVEGIRIVETDDLSNIQADLYGAVGTPYEGGVFRCKLVLDADFPASPPKAFFLTKIFHPNIALNGSVCVNTLKKDWKPTYGISHIFQVIRCLLIVPFPESALNEEASKLFLESYDEYAKRAKLMTQVHAKAKVLVHASSSDSQPGVENEEANDQSSTLKHHGSTASDACSSTVSSAASDNQAAKKVDIKKRALKRL